MKKTLLALCVLVACVPMSRGGGGFATGPAPARHVQRGPSADVETCTFSSDCGEDRSCRADASGMNVCMGGGYAGDPCWFSSDCVSGSCSDKVCR
jgi:hypothetical protein